MMLWANLCAMTQNPISQSSASIRFKTISYLLGQAVMKKTCYFQCRKDQEPSKRLSSLVVKENSNFQSMKGLLPEPQKEGTEKLLLLHEV